MSVLAIKDKAEFGSQINKEDSSSKLSESSSFRQWLEFVPRGINLCFLTDLFSQLETPSQDRISKEGAFNKLAALLKNNSNEDLGKITLNVNASGSIKEIAEGVIGFCETAEDRKKALEIESRNSSYALILPFNSDRQSYDPIQLAQRDWKNNCWIIKKEDGTAERIDFANLSDRSQLIFMRKTVCSEISSFADPTEKVADRNPSGEYRVANGSSSSPNSPPFFQEVQFDGFCGKHSINNMSGAHTIGAGEMIEKQYFSQDSEGKISTCSYKAHPEILHAKFGTASKRIDVTKDTQGQVSQQLGKADRFTRADDNGHDGSGHVSA